MTRTHDKRALWGLFISLLLIAPVSRAAKPVSADGPVAAPPPEAKQSAPASAPATGPAPAAAAAAAPAPATTPTPSTTPAPAAQAPAPVPATAPQPAAAKPPPPPPPTEAQVDLGKVRTLLTKKKFDQALKLLDEAEQAEGADKLHDQFAEQRVEALLLKKHKDTKKAQEIVLDQLHRDPEGKVFDHAPEGVTAFVSDLRDNHPLVIHVPQPAIRAGHPLRLRAHVQDLKDVIAAVKVHIRGHNLGSYSDANMEQGNNGWSVLIRDPGSMAPDGVSEDYVIDYYLSAENAAGEVVDTDGSADAPLTVSVSTAKAETVEASSGVDLNAVTKAENAPPPVVVEAPKVTPWYLQWYTLTAAGIIVGAAVIVPTAVVASRPHAKLPSHLATLAFSVSP